MAAYRPDFRLSAAPAAARWLGLAGLIPFLVLSGLALFGPAAAEIPAEALLAGYGAAILAFLGGARWGLACAGMGEGADWWTLGVAVAPPLLAFAALAVGQPWSLVILALSLIAVFAADMALTAAGGAPAWWPSLRLPPTVVATLCLLAPAAL